MVEVTSRRAYWIVTAIVAVGLISLSQLQGLQFNYDFEDFFDKQDPEWIRYERHVEQFGYDNDYLLVALKPPASIYRKAFLQKVDSTIGLLTALPGVVRILSPLNASKVIRSPMGTILIPYLHIEDQQRLLEDSLLVADHPNAARRLINHEVPALAMIVYHERYADKTKEGELNKNIETTLHSQFGDNFAMAGRIRGQTVFIQLIRQNFGIFLSIALFLIAGFLFYLYRAIKWMIIPLLAIGMAVLVTLGAMAWTGQAIDVLSSMLPTIILITAMSDVVHFLTRYFDLRSAGTDNKVAVMSTLREVGLATFLTSLTTAIGFASLVITDSVPVKNLGIYTALGVMIAYVISFSILTATCVIEGTNTSGHRTSGWDKPMERLFLLATRQHKSLVAVYFVLTLAAALALQWLIIDTPLIADFPKNHAITRDFRFFDEHFGGSKPFEIQIEVIDPAQDMISPAVIKEIDLLSDFLKTKLSNVVSPSDLMRSLNMANHRGNADYYTLPDAADERRVYRQFPQMAHFFPVDLIDDSNRMGRITGYSKDVGSTAGLRFQEEFSLFVRDNINPQLLKVSMTGTSYLFDLSTESLVNNVISGLSLAVLTVAVIMALLFRSVRMILIAVICNILPLLFLAAFMATTGIPLRLSTSIIFAIAFGIAVDDTIHFLSRYKLALAGQSVENALKDTFLSTGKAMIVTTLILSVGFVIFTFSSFDATFYTGLLISLTLAMALVIDLTLLPALLYWMTGKNNVHPSQ